MVDVRLIVNGADRTVEVDPRTTLLDALRENLGLTGAKKGCDHGECGTCTVLADGRPILACLRLMVMCQGASVVTIEGLGSEGDLHPLQRAFAEHDALQCGFCTPGQILSAVGCLAAGRAGTDADVREWMSGTLCRCAGYPQIVAAVRAAAGAG